MKILIVEDDPIQATSLKLKLKPMISSDIFIAYDGISALSICQSESISLVFCDIHMPNMDGVSLLSQISKISTSIGIVIYSAAEDEVLRLTEGMCRLAGFIYVTVLKKSYDSKNLANIINEVRLAFQTPDTNENSISVSVSDVEKAFKNDEIFNFYQPQFDFKTGLITGVEALARMSHPTYGVLTPNFFLPQIEMLDLLDKLFDLVLKKAIAAISNLSESLDLSININKSDLQNPICDKIIAICKANNFNPERLTLELVENQIYNSSPDSLANLAKLRMHNIGLAIDDFGTGYASLSQLNELPFTELKIDRSFVKNLSDNYKHQQLTQMCLLLAQSLALHCVVEGVEDEDTWEYLRNLGVETCQGYYCSPPIEINDLQELYCRNKLNSTITEGLKGEVKILIIDENKISGVALQRQLIKSPDISQVKVADNINAALHALRDFPINFVILETPFKSNMLDKHLIQIINKKYQKNTIILCNDTCEENLQSLQGFTLKKRLTLAETTNEINDLLKKLKLESEYKSDLKTILSEREYNVARLLRNGMNNKAIANEMNISQKTVSTYKTRILSKLKINTTIELIQFFK
ncbi:EAL domain-containing protein [Shewanella marisflavi]|uniref:EAL domain-containing protein n=1 Tax=Shewanella marisflavi TaxID=260364 RepID=UPI003AAD32AA